MGTQNVAKIMLINSLEEEESRVAITQDGQLIDFNYEICSREQSRGNIFKGVVTKIEPSLQAAFVDYGAERAGFLPVGEVREQAMSGRPADPRKPKIEEVLRKKQEIMVQVVKEPVGTKGAALSTRIAIPGRYLVIMPGDTSGGISRKIADDDSRRKAKQILRELGPQDDMGIILRTAGMDRSVQEIKTDFLYLNKLWNTVMENYMRAKAPAMVYQESDVILRSIRDYFTPDVSEILTDSPETFNRILSFVMAVMPNFQNRVRLYEGARPLFDAYRLEEQIHRLHEQRVRLKSGGEIVISQTEALVAVDVNSGKATGEKDAEATAFRTNCEAAEEVARQIRLRDLGGLVVVDFIDMREMRHVREVEKTVRGALRADKARIETTRISKLGLMEISRQRLKKSLYTTSFSPCPGCSGTGIVRSVETLALSVLRNIQSRVALGDIAFVRGDLPADVLVYLVNAKRDELVRLQNLYEVRIQLNIRPERQSISGPAYSTNPGDWLEFHRRLRRLEKKPRVATVEQAVQATAEERKQLEAASQAKADEARAAGEPEVVVQAILEGEDPEAVRRRLIEDENRKARIQVKQKGRSGRHGFTKLPPLTVDESDGIEAFLLGPDGAVKAKASSGKTQEARSDRDRSDRSARKERTKRPPKEHELSESLAFAGLIANDDGSISIPSEDQATVGPASEDRYAARTKRKKRRTNERQSKSDQDRYSPDHAVTAFAGIPIPIK